MKTLTRLFTTLLFALIISGNGFTQSCLVTDIQCDGVTIQLDADGTASIIPADLVTCITSFVDFEGVFAPDLFSSQDQPITDYTGSDLSFTGTWEVLDGVSFSTSLGLDNNKLAWNTSVTSPTQTITFAQDASNVSFEIASFDVTVSIEAFDINGMLIENQNIFVTSTAQVVNLSASNISYITITVPSGAGCFDNLSYDYCGPSACLQSVTASQTNFDCTNIGDNNITLTADDYPGVDCMTNVTVVDATAPIAVCQDITVSVDATGNVSIDATQIDNGSSDNCGIVSMSLNITDFTCDDVGDNTVTFTIMDDAGNTEMCNATVTVLDTNCSEPPISDEVPTVGEWGLIILGLLMLIVAVVGIRQKVLVLE